MSEKKETLYKQEGEMAIFFAWPAMEVFNKLDSRYFDFGFGKLYGYLKNGYITGYYDIERMDSLAKYVFNKYSNNNRLINFYDDYLRAANDLQNLYFRCKREDIMSLKKDGLREFFQIIRNKYYAFWSMSLFIDSFDNGLDQLKVKEFGEKYGMNSDELAELTMPNDITYGNERILDLLKMAKSIDLEKYEKNKLDYLENFSPLSEYIKKYDYYKSNYFHIEHITKKEIGDELDDYYKDEKLLEETYEKLKNYSSIQKNNKKEILDKYGLDENPLHLFAQLTYWREHRKQTNLMGIHLLSFILESLEVFTNIPMEYLKNSVFEEFDDILNETFEEEILRARSNGMMVVLDENDYEIVVGEEAEFLKCQKEKEIAETKKVEIIKGFVASKGLAKGIVKVVLNKANFEKFEEGDILVTVMTRPEFVPLMKKAVAIVTDEGGVTCHAAIVARELKIPCIIGTRIATQALKDGDEIEVDANKGLIKILN